MVKYNCERCGFTTRYKGNFKKHLFRKNICEAIIKDISIDILREKYGFKMSTFCHTNVNPILENCHTFVNPMSYQFGKKSLKNEYFCDFCDKKFKSRQGKSKHQNKYCKKRKKKIDKELHLLNMLQKKDEEMKN